ncbi:MAG: 6-phospho-beta-glucosidase [Ktedonobacterales bacterium]|jgi:6-phospho-beta-glucosidase|nr:MAG: 6-phospho-beta-glucosidase [Ktedonobacterales bacterium]
MARIKLAYIGGGSTRAAGTMASFIWQGAQFNGSEVVLIDLDKERLITVETIARKMARARGLDLTIRATTNRREGLHDCDAVLTSFRPGGFEARYLDESIPLKHGVIGQETQGPGGFFMALRSIHVMKSIVEDMEAVCPNARLFNYTNPVNIVSEAVTHHTAIATVSLCEGPIVSNREYVSLVGLDPDALDAVSVGLNHGSWTVRHLYDGQDVMPLLRAGYARLRQEKSTSVASEDMRLLDLACRMDSLPSSYFQYYYFKDEILAELQHKSSTRAQDIMASVPDYWAHYREQADRDEPELDPARSRGGIHELELGIDVMDAIFNDRKEVWYVNVPNRGSLLDFPDDMVVETVGFVDRNGVRPLAMGHLPRHVVGLVKMLGEYQALTAEAAWSGTRTDAIRALASHPLVFSLAKAEDIYNELAAAHQRLLPERLLT